MSQGHPDFAHAWRGDMTDAECEEASANGLLRLWDEGIGAGLLETTLPKTGDIAVVRFLGHETGSIFTGDKWAIRSEKGIAFIAQNRIAVLKAWAL